MIQKKWKFLKQKKVKIKKRGHALKGSASAYNIKILNVFKLNCSVRKVNLQLNA